jgi:hypothetical protein
LCMWPIVPSIVMTTSEAFYYALGEGRFEPTRATESPWDQTAQHGGPPAALLAHLIDATVEGEPRLARLSIDFLGAIPRAPVTVTVESVKPGRRVWLSQARMTVDDRDVAVARTWHIATGPRPPIDDEHTEPPTLPATPATQRSFFGLSDWGYGDAIEWRFTEGGFDTPGRAGVWTRVGPALSTATRNGCDARCTLSSSSAAAGSRAMTRMRWRRCRRARWWTRPPTGSGAARTRPIGGSRFGSTTAPVGSRAFAAPVIATSISCT